MPAADSPAILVARFLKANHYTETLEAFIREAGLDPDAGTIGPGDWTLEKVLEEKKQYDASLKYEKRFNENDQGWTLPAPSSANAPEDLQDLANVLCVGYDRFGDYVFVTTADRKCHLVETRFPYKKKTGSGSILQESPILSVQPLGGHGIVAWSSMAGALALHDLPNDHQISTRRDHAKYAVQVAACYFDSSSNPGHLVATAGWDQKVNIYWLSGAEMGQFSTSDLQDPFHTIVLPSNPESLVFARHPDTGCLHLILSRRDSTFLYYYAITQASNFSSQLACLVTDAGRQNLAPHSNAWISFTPSCLALCPTDPTLLAVATSHLPHMKLIIVRLLFPGEEGLAPSSPQNGQHRTPASVARASLAVQDREERAITIHVSTFAPQTPYSTPQVVWRPDGSGVWINGDDGVVRGLDIRSGKVVASLKAHEQGAKVRTLWAGHFQDPSERTKREALITGGFDKKVFVWEVKDQ